MTRNPQDNPDQVIGFTIPERHARGRLVQMGPVIDTILAHHNYPPVIERILAEAIVLAALIGSTLKADQGQMTMQAQTEAGVIDLLVCDYRNGEVRGYLQHDPNKLAEAGANPSLFALFGKGYLALTFDMAVTGERYQGIVPLEGASLADAAEHYFIQSEQIPTLIRIHMIRHPDGTYDAGGLLVQHLPEGEEGRERLHVREELQDWEHVSSLAHTVSQAELTDSRLAPTTLLWRLFNEDEVHINLNTSLSRGCRCTVEHYKSVLHRFPEAERAEMANENGMILVDCAFCAKQFEIQSNC